jgi:cysteinyl-tRNA synthetase
VFRLYDTRTSQPAQIALRPRGLLQMFVGGPLSQHRGHAGDLRTFVLADLIRRNAEHRHDLAVVATLVIPEVADGIDADGSAGDDGFRADTAALNVRPAEQTASAPAVGESVTSHEIIVGTCRVSAGPVRFEGREMAGPGADAAAPAVRLAELAERELDPLALRLSYLSGHYRDQADLSWDVLSEANRELRRWRERVAEWAESPSKPMCAAVTAQIAAAFDDDLDTAEALRALRGLEQDPAIPPGSKFESFMHADQLLGLDLPREIGRWSPPSQRNNSPS